jgi:phosphoribosyl 1,2-cyclic phosphodiesterase
MEVRLWGTRGSIASPGPDTLRYGGNTTCVEVLVEPNERIIIDAGTGIRGLGRGLMALPQPLDCHLLITHIHWDHILGFPFFMPIYQDRTRIRVDGSTRAIQGLRATLNNRMVDGIFPVNFSELPARISHDQRLAQGPLRIGEAEVEGIELQHPQGGMGFRIRERDKVMVFLTDNELRADAWRGRTPADYARFSQGAQLLIHDAQYRPEQMAEKRGWGHSDYISTVELALKAGVERLVLFHHDPDRSDLEVDEMVGAAQQYALAKGRYPLVVKAAGEGSTWEL